MNKPLLIAASILVFSAASFAQEKTNDDINRQIRSLGVDHLDVTYDQASNTSKLMAVSENFGGRDAESAGVLAVNFAIGFFYQGTALKTPPETVHFAFWVLTKKPRFADSHHLTVDLNGRTLDLGEARYAAKPNQNVEYLNFEISRADLAAIGSAGKTTFHLGQHTFVGTLSQTKLILAVNTISGTSVAN